MSDMFLILAILTWFFLVFEDQKPQPKFPLTFIIPMNRYALLNHHCLTACGEDLTAWAHLLGTCRFAEENDSDLRLRCIEIMKPLTMPDRHVGEDFVEYTERMLGVKVVQP
jgi:hypothetical protein